MCVMMINLSDVVTDSYVPYVVKPLLKIVDDILPKKHTVSGEQFSPLSLEWKVLTMFHFTEELHTNYDGKKRTDV